MAEGTVGVQLPHTTSFVIAEGAAGGMRAGQGRPVSRQAWPDSGALRDWLVFCNRVHQANGQLSLRALAAALGLTSASRVGEMLRGLALPADEKQARDLLGALGAVGPEVERGARLYEAARAGRVLAARGAGRPGWWLRCGYLEQIGDIAPLRLLGRQDELDELRRLVRQRGRGVRVVAGRSAGG